MKPPTIDDIRQGYEGNAALRAALDAANEKLRLAFLVIENAKRATDAATERAERAEGDVRSVHAALTRAGVPEQIAPIKAPLAHVSARIVWLTSRADRLAEAHMAIHTMRYDHYKTDRDVLSAVQQIVAAALAKEGK